MNKFWKWMENKEYYLKGNGLKSDIYEDNSYEYILPTKQMLIGYMLEYIREKGLWNSEIREKIPLKMKLIHTIFSDNIYQDLELIIKELD